MSMLQRRVALTSLRGHKPTMTSMSASDIRALWQRRLAEKGEGHPLFLYVHIPFCPQICSFCQCSTEKLARQADLTSYLEWLEDEISFFAPALRPGVVQFQYIGGGTPNILDDAQLERLLGTLDRSFRFAPDARRTFEFLPSALRPGTLELVRRFGYNRLSCGIQSQAPQTLLRVLRSTERLDDTGAIIEEALGLGYDEINLDLVWGLPEESHESFVASLLQTLALGPTTITIHKLLPLPTRPRSPEEEIELDRGFVALAPLLRPVVEAAGFAYTLIHRINGLIAVRTEFLESGRFSFLYYSDNERIHYDMLGLGRYAGSRIMGRCLYDCASRAKVFDPDEKAYDSFMLPRGMDAALDLLTDLVAEGACDLRQLERRYGADEVAELAPELRRLEALGTVGFDGTTARYEATDYVFVDPLISLVDAVSGRERGQGGDGEMIETGEGPIRVVVERARSGRKYFQTIAHIGVFYSVPRGSASPAGPVIARVLGDVTRRISAILADKPLAGAVELNQILFAAERGRAD